MNDIPQNTRPLLKVGQVIKRGEFFFGHPAGLEGNVGDVRSQLQHPPEHDYRQTDNKAADFNAHSHIFYTIGSGILFLGDSKDKTTAADFNVSGRIMSHEYIKPSELSRVRNFVSENERYGTAIVLIADDKTTEKTINPSHTRIVPVSSKDYIENDERPKKDFINKTVYDYHFNPETYKMPQYEVEKGAVIIDLSHLNKDELKQSLQNLRNGIFPEGVTKPENESYVTPFVVIRKGIDGKKPVTTEERENDGDWVVESYVKYKGKYEAVASANYENAFADGMGKPEVIKRSYGESNITHEKVSQMSAAERADFVQNNSMPTERILLTKNELEQQIEQSKNLDQKELEKTAINQRTDNMAASYMLLETGTESNKDRFKNFKELSTLSNMVDVLVNNNVEIPKVYNSIDIVDLINNKKEQPKEIDNKEQEYLANILKNARFSPDTKIEISGKGEAQQIKLNLHDQAYNFDREKGSFVKE